MKVTIHNLTSTVLSAHLGGGLGFEEKPTPLPARSSTVVDVPVARNPLACVGPCVRASDALVLRAEPLEEPDQLVALFGRGRDPFAIRANNLGMASDMKAAWTFDSSLVQSASIRRIAALQSAVVFCTRNEVNRASSTTTP